MAIITLPDGRKAIRLRNVLGKARHYESFPKGKPYEEIKRREAELKAGRAKVRESDATVLSACLDYITFHSHEFTDLGRERIESIVRNHVQNDPLGSVSLSDPKLTRHILTWRVRRKQAGASDGTLDR